jgi:hypothetical protein
MTAVDPARLDLLVEESGNPDELGDRLAEYAAMQALHLSCHGHNAWPSGKPGTSSRCCFWRRRKARCCRRMWID